MKVGNVPTFVAGVGEGIIDVTVLNWEVGHLGPNTFRTGYFQDQSSVRTWYFKDQSTFRTRVLLGPVLFGTTTVLLGPEYF